MAARAWLGELPALQIVPEGVEDISVYLDSGWLHLQVKSRRAHRGVFALADLSSAWRRLAERLAADPRARAGVVLERELPGAVSGLAHTLADGSSDRLRDQVAEAVVAVIDPEEFLRRAHVLTMLAPEQTTVRLIADRLGLPPASCAAHQAILRGELASLADENGIRVADKPASMTPADVGRLLDAVSEAVDPSALEEAVRDGIAEAVDFVNPIDDARFYSGVDVGPGHVVAGLPLGRPEVEELVAAVMSSRLALAVGPSGSGKSALIWLAAFETRHQVRWYRVRRLRESDARPLVRLVRGLTGTGATVGFVVDDLGREDRAGFDRLVEELREQPTAVVLGACREEDLFVVPAATTADQVRPRLDEALAERIWHELRVSGGTSVSGWRESFERSEGLLLEYGHLLTSGERLKQTVSGQVLRRVRERRGLELEVLGLVATADAFGAQLDGARVRAAVGATAVDMREALERLSDEHLVTERDGLLGGLHELRSQQVTDEVHRRPPPTLFETIARVIDLVAGPGLQPVVLRVLRARAAPDDIVLEAVAARLEREPDASALASALHALRLVGFSRLAERWSEVFDEEFVGPTHAPLIAQLLVTNSDLSIYPEPIQRAVARIREIPLGDLREPLLVRCAPVVPAALAAAPDVRSAASVLAALGEVERPVAIDPSVLADVLSPDAPLSDVRLLLEAAYLTSAELAAAVANKLGGAPALLEYLEEELPWVRRVELNSDEQGQLTASAEYAYVAQSVQTDPHGDVVELAAYLLALAPAAQIARCRAIDATGEVAGGHRPIADKTIDRRNLPAPARVAWNRARVRASIAASAFDSKTEHLLAERDLIERTASLMREAGDAWARRRRPSRRLDDAAAELATAARQLRPAPIRSETSDPLDHGEFSAEDAVGFIGVMVPNNLLPRLYAGENVAPLATKLVDLTDRVAAPAYWRLIQDPPLKALAQLRQSLDDLHATLRERDRGTRATTIAFERAGRRGLAAMARLARQHANRRVDRDRRELEAALAEKELSAHVLHRAGSPDPTAWPFDEVLVLVDVASISDWSEQLETIIDICRPAVRHRLDFLLAPVRDQRIVGSCGLQVLPNSFIQSRAVAAWDRLPMPLLDEQLGEQIDRVFTRLMEASGIVASLRGGFFHEKEAAVVEAAQDRIGTALDWIGERAADGDPLLVEVQDMIAAFHDLFVQEIGAVVEGEEVGHSLAAALLEGVNGEVNDLYSEYVGIEMAAVEWDVEPNGALERLGVELRNP